MAEAVDYAHERGVVVVASAGNDGSTVPSYPAALPHVLSIAASDQNDALYGFSNRGETVDLAAPGCTVSITPGNSVAPRFCGTSAAAPFVAGLAELLLSVSPGLAPDQVEQVLGTGPSRSRASAAAGSTPPPPSPPSVARPRRRRRRRRA